MKNLVIVSLLVVLSGCEMLATKAGEALLGASSDGIRADAEVTVGQKKEDNDVNVDVGNKSGDQTYTAEKIVTNTNERMSAWVLITIIFLAGWAIPAPNVMFSSLVSFARKIFSSDQKKDK